MQYDMPDDIYEETLEYHGSTTIERVVRLAGTILKRKWLLFDTVEEALVQG